MKIKYIAIPAAIAVTLYIGVSAYMIISQNISELIVCTNDKTLNVPFSEELCHGYLYGFRGSEDDIKVLQQNGGVSFVVGAAQAISEKQRMVKFFIAKGLDVNGPDAQGVLPLQLAVLEGSADNIRLLLDSGADPLLAGSRISLKPLILAEKLRSEGKLRGDGDVIVGMLEAAEQAAKKAAPADRRPDARAGGG